MATLPRPTTVLDDPDDLPMGDESLSGPEGTGGYEICIRVGMDKKLAVGVKEDGPGGEVTGPDESIVSPAPAYQPVSNIRDALTLALDIYRSNGDMAETSDTDESFDAGFRRP